jgi:hypothetical protein
MRKFKYPAFGLFLLTVWVFPGQSGDAFQFSQTEEILTFLENAAAVSVQPDENAGRTEPWMVMLDDGKVRHKAIFKHIDRTRPYPLADSYKYELCAYKLHRMLGLDFIPPVTARTINDRQGALQLFMEDCMPLEEAKRKEDVKIDLPSIQDKMREICVFDALTYCGCGQTEDVLYQISSGQICRVDYSQAFAPMRELPPECSIQGCSQEFLDNLKELDEDIIRKELSPYLNEEEISALLMRMHLIIEKLENKSE